MTLTGKIYKIKLTLRGGQKEEYNMSYIGSEPSEDEILGFLKNFRPYLFSQVASADWEYLREMTEREM
jgi:hypothetical protein